MPDVADADDILQVVDAELLQAIQLLLAIA
jgi:hypothetical protein